jgi:hypothetical protein
MRHALFGLAFVCLTLVGCAAKKQTMPTIQAPQSTGPTLADAYKALEIEAAAFVPLSLEAGTYEAEYVDAYYGPDALKKEAEARPRSLEQLLTAARNSIRNINNQVLPFRGSLGRDLARANMLRGQLLAAVTRMEMIGGKRFPFDAEAIGLFSTQPAIKPLSSYDPILASLEKLVPGKGTLASRVDAFSDRYLIPSNRLKPVFDAAIAECKRRTLAHMILPKEESFTLEFVMGKPWSGYNYYQGQYKSLIQVNTDLPIRISRAVDLGCHEGYPGHHVLNLMIEDRLVNQNHWNEYQVNPLYSPQSVLSEGSANYGIDLAFPGEEKLAFERDVLYPLAGLDPKSAQAYHDLQAATEALGGARLTIAKMYLDGDIDRAKAVELSQKYLLVSAKRAEQSIVFTDHYRSYVINYGWGKELVRGYVERINENGKAPDTQSRWARMEKILSEPTLPEDMEDLSD